MKFRKRHPLFIFFILMLMVVVPITVLAEEPSVEPPPNPNQNFADVNGDPSEWTSADFFGNLYVDGVVANGPVGEYFLRYSCRPNRRILYVYTRLTQTNWSISTGITSQRININGVTHVFNSTGDNNSPPDWAVVNQRSFEASFVPIFIGNTQLDISLTVVTNTGSTLALHVSDSADTVAIDTIPCSLAVELASFEATAQTDNVLLEWQTASETDNLGFNLYRSTVAEEVGEQLNGELIPSHAPGSGQGADYEFVDDTGVPGTTYYYSLEDVDLSGTTTLHGPVSALYPTEPSVVTLTGFDSNAPTPRWTLPLSALALGLLGIALSWRRFRTHS